MKRTLTILAIAGLSLVAVAVRAAAPTAPAPVIIKADAVKWAPGTGPMKGMQVAALYGDPNKAGAQYALRVKCPDGMVLPPHKHALEEQVTVVSGTFVVGVGTKMDDAKTVALPAGSFVQVPAGVPHYAKCKGETVIEAHGVGKFTWVDAK
jgi:quercetin dioxygenase-like cupin family protein